MKKILIISWLIFFSIGISYAETVIHLKSGGEVKGELVEKTDEYVKIKIRGGNITFWNNDIKSVEFIEPEPTPEPAPTPAPEPKKEDVPIKPADIQGLLQSQGRIDKQEEFFKKYPILKDLNKNSRFPSGINLAGFTKDIGRWGPKFLLGLLIIVVFLYAYFAILLRL